MENRKKLIISLAFLFTINILVILFAQSLPRVSAATYREGSNGSVVSQVQSNLKQWGYYSGSVDGIFGPKTTEAVKYFQSTNGLTADGIVGPATLEKLGISVASNTSSSQSNDLYLLSRIISAEARGEPYAGQVAVGAVALNRVKHPSFPNTLAGVVYQKDAFTAVTDGQFNEPIADISRKAAQEALNGSDPTGGAIYYYNPATATSKWIFSRPIIARIGNHVFCM